MFKRLTYLSFVAFVVALLGGAAQAELVIAEDLLVDLRAVDLPKGAAVTTWPNHGSAAGDFTANESGQPIGVEIVAGAQAVTFNGADWFDGPISPDGIEGAGTRSIEVWAYNPSILEEETLVAWAYRGGPGATNMSFNYGNNDLWGAVGHWDGGVYDLGWWGAHSPAPAAGTWWYLVYTYDGTAARVYVNGVEESVRNLITLNTWPDMPIKIGTQNENNTGAPSGIYFTGSIAIVRIHDGVLGPADILNNFEFSPVVGATSPVPANGAAQSPTVSGANVYMMLDYTPGKGAVTHTGYFSDNIDDVISRDPAHCLNQPPWPDMDEEAFVVGYDDDAIEEFARAPLVFGETYYWCVDEFDGTQPWPGEVWSFLAMGEKAWGPTPADDDIFVPSNQDLNLIWNLGDLDMDGYLNKVTYKVYFGTDETDLPLLEAPEPNTCVVPGTALEPETTYYWRVDEIRREDSVPFPSVATEGDVWSFTTGPIGLGSMLYEYWLNIGGTAVSGLTNDPRYPDSPDGSNPVTLFEGPTGWADNYGARMHGWLYVRNTGDYTFWIATDDNGELWLSTDSSPDNAALISWVGDFAGGGWADPRQWDDPDVTPSEPIHLVRGERYYISGLIKEGGGGDNIAVAWEGPDSGGVREVIPGGSLMGYVPLAAHKPNPANGGIDVALNAMLSWTPGTEETTGAPYTIQHVYVGSDATAVAGATTGSDEYMGVVGTSQYGPLSLSYLEQVYWRVDSEDSGTGTIYPSSVWTFKAIYNPANVADAHLRLWLKFDGDPCDSSGYGRDGTEMNGPTYSLGYDERAIFLDGVDDYIDLPIGPDIASLTNSTFATWVNFDNIGGAWQRIFDFGSGTDTYLFLCPRIDVDGQMRFAIKPPGAAEQIVDTTTYLSSGWRHIAVTIDAAYATANIYLDGEIVGTNTAVTLTPSDVGESTQNWLGRSQYVADGYFSGALDDFRIYDYAMDSLGIAKVMRINLAWAYNPDPVNGATGVARTPMLTWTGGDYATSHYVFFGTDEDALPQVAGPQPTTSYSPGILDLGTTYYWAIGEANAAAPPDYMDRGRTWRFTTADYVVIDDMDAYVAYDVPAGPHIFVAWRDGKGDCAGSGNDTGANLLETTPLFGGSQLMRYDWDNDGLVLNPCTGAADDPRGYYYSKIVAQVTGLPSGIGSNWTIGGVKALSLLFYGDTLNSINDPLWVQLSDSSGPGTKVEYGKYAGESLGDIQDPAWHEWLIDLNDFDVQLTNVVSIAIGIGDENATGPHISSGTLYIDDVRLYTPRCIPSRNTGGFADADYAPVGAPDCVVDYKELKVMGQDWAQFDYNVYSTAPDPAGLVASYQFENNANDSSPNGNHGTEQGGPTYTTSRPGLGMALDFDGVDDYVDCGNDASFNLTDSLTITCWIRVGTFDKTWQAIVTKGDDSWRLHRGGDTDNINFAGTGLTPLSVSGSVNVNDGAWHHVAAVYDGTQRTIYVDGLVDVSESVSGTIDPGTYNVMIGENAQATGRFWTGSIDDLRIYDYDLSHGEILGVAGMSTLYVPVSSPANISDDEPQTERKVNFLDYAELMDFWGMEQEWPSW